MKAIIYPKPHCWKYQDTPTPQPGPEDVLIRIKSCGVCATDLHIYNGEFISRFPLVPGHEFSGEVATVFRTVSQSVGSQSCSPSVSFFSNEAAKGLVGDAQISFVE